MSPYRIVLADDHVMFRQGIKNILEGAENLEVVGEAGDGLDLLKILKKMIPDMVILDKNDLSRRESVDPDHAQG